jgi:hypothetical protein
MNTAAGSIYYLCFFLLANTIGTTNKSIMTTAMIVTPRFISINF